MYCVNSKSSEHLSSLGLRKKTSLGLYKYKSRTRNCCTECHRLEGTFRLLIWKLFGN